MRELLLSFVHLMKTEAAHAYEQALTRYSFHGGKTPPKKPDILKD
jgi:hypothetical protein